MVWVLFGSVAAMLVALLAAVFRPGARRLVAGSLKAAFLMVVVISAAYALVCVAMPHALPASAQPGAVASGFTSVVNWFGSCGAQEQILLLALLAEILALPAVARLDLMRRVAQLEAIERANDKHHRREWTRIEGLIGVDPAAAKARLQAQKHSILSNRSRQLAGDLVGG